MSEPACIPILFLHIIFAMYIEFFSLMFHFMFLVKVGQVDVMQFWKESRGDMVCMVGLGFSVPRI